MEPNTDPFGSTDLRSRGIICYFIAAPMLLRQITLTAILAEQERRRDR